MAGKVHKADLMHQPWKLFTLLPDWRTIRFWYFRRRRDNRDDTCCWPSSTSSPPTACVSSPPWTFARSCSCDPEF